MKSASIRCTVGEQVPAPKHLGALRTRLVIHFFQCRTSPTVQAEQAEEGVEVKLDQMQLVTTLYHSCHTMWGGGAATESKNILLEQQEVGTLFDNVRSTNPKPDPDGSPAFDVQRSFMLK
jgi:hypothetical protein